MQQLPLGFYGDLSSHAGPVYQGMVKSSQRVQQQHYDQVADTISHKRRFRKAGPQQPSHRPLHWHQSGHVPEQRQQQPRKRKGMRTSVDSSVPRELLGPPNLELDTYVDTTEPFSDLQENDVECVSVFLLLSPVWLVSSLEIMMVRLQGYFAKPGPCAWYSTGFHGVCFLSGRRLGIRPDF